MDGRADSVREFLDRMDVLAADLLYWQLAIGTVPRAPESAQAGYLRAKAAEHQRVNPDDPAQIRSRVRGWVDVERPPGWTFARVQELKGEIALRLAEARRPRAWLADHPAAPEETRGAVPAVTVRIEPGQSEELVVRVDNLRDQAIEALEWDEYRLPSARPDGSHQIDSALAPDDSRRITRGVPGEFVVASAVGGAAGRERTVALSLVVWTDLTFEGSRARYDALLRKREVQAEGYTYWIEVLGEASRLSMRDAVDHLQRARARRRGERPRELDLMASKLANWDRASAATPDRPAAFASDHRATLERQRAQLLRHRTSR